jgi:hypothetical protein
VEEGEKPQGEEERRRKAKAGFSARKSYNFSAPSLLFSL